MKKNKRSLRLFLAGLSVLCFGLTGCKENYTPKPRTYIRIGLPEKAYRNFDTTGVPATFRLPVHTRFEAVAPKEKKQKADWADIVYPGLNSRIYCSFLYRPDLDSCIMNTLFFIQRHISKATGVDEWEINRPEHRVYGYLYHIKGNDVASPYQFYLTDSNRYFFRGSFSINCVPNNDSLSPIIDFVKTDIDTLIESWRWR